MIQIFEIIKKEREEFALMKEQQKVKKIDLNVDPKGFKELFEIQLNKIILSRNIKRSFEFTEENKRVINQIYFYCTNNKEKFIGNLDKGIMIVGKNGVGKTLILKSFCNTVALLSTLNITQIHAKKIQKMVLLKEDGFYERRPLLIDDLGKEQKEFIDYGTKISPIPDLLSLRYDNGALTFATSNYNMTTLEKYYGTTITDRFKEMFNIIQLDGVSFRK